MRFAAILGTCLLLPPVHSVDAAAVSRSTQSQENPQSNSSPQDSTERSPNEQQKAPEQSSTPPPTPAPATPPCVQNSQPGSTVKPVCKPAESSGAKTKKHHRSQKAVAAAGTPGETGPPKTVVPNGGTAEPSVDLSPGLSRQQASHQMESTNQLLASSDANLKKIAGRQLSASQQDTVKQVKSYI